MPNRFENEAAYDVLFVGEQTSLVMRLVAALVREGYRPAILNGPVLVEKLHVECSVDADHFACPPVHLPGRYKAPVIRTLEWPMQRSRLRNAIRRIAFRNRERCIGHSSVRITGALYRPGSCTGGHAK